MSRAPIRIAVRAVEFVRTTLWQVVLQRRRSVHGRIPNAETITALNEPTHNLKQFKSVDDLFADIEARAPRPQRCSAR